MNQPLIRLTEIAAAYDQKKVLEHINLENERNNDFCLFNPERTTSYTEMGNFLSIVLYWGK